MDVVPHLAYAALSDESNRVRRQATLMLVFQPRENRIRRILLKIERTAKDQKILTSARYGLAMYDDG